MKLLGICQDNTMYNLYMLNEVFSGNLNYSLLNGISGIAVFCGILVIIVNNPIVSILFLIGLFISIAGYLMMLGINFIGLSYLLVYVGAVSILFLFILMLINVRISELVTNSSNSIPLAIMIGIFFNTNNLLPSLTDTSMIFTSDYDKHLYSNHSYLANLYLATSNSWDTRLAETSHITSIGNVIYTNYPIWLFLTSIILLLAMIGSILITIKQ